MRYITYGFIAGLLFILSVQAYHIRQDMAEINATLGEIQGMNAQLQKESERQRQELDRITREASRSGNRRMMEISYYTPAADENGGYDGTSSGAPLTVGRTIAAGPGIPFGTRIFIPGVGWRVVEDRGSAITDGRIDVLVEDKEIAYANGRHMAQVVIER